MNNLRKCEFVIMLNVFNSEGVIHKESHLKVKLNQIKTYDFFQFSSSNFASEKLFDISFDFSISMKRIKGVKTSHS